MTRLQKVLVIDDEAHIRLLLRKALIRSGYAVAELGAARGLAETLAAETPDLVMLDLGLPDRDGLELIPLIRQHGDAAIVVSSARDATDQKIAALDLGADDYVTKPFDTDEVLARLRAALRHRMARQGEASAIVVGDVEINLVQRRVTKAGAEVHLTPQEYDTLAELAKFPSRVITHAKLVQAVWRDESDGQVEYLRVVVRNLRQKLETDRGRPTLILNEPGVGYRLSC